MLSVIYIFHAQALCADVHVSLVNNSPFCICMYYSCLHFLGFFFFDEHFLGFFNKDHDMNNIKSNQKNKKKIGTISIKQMLIKNSQAQLKLEYLHVRSTRCMCILAMATFCFVKSKFHLKKELSNGNLPIARALHDRQI